MSTYAAPIPGASSYGQAALLAQQAFNNAKATIAQKRGGLLQQYGYTQGADGSFGVDPNNPYGQYQQMLKNQSAATHSAEDQARVGGFSSGYRNAGLANLKYSQGAESSTLGQNLTNSLADLTTQENQAAYDQNAALYQAEQNAANQAIANQQYSVADLSGVGSAPTSQAAAVKAAVAKPAAKAKAKLVKQVVQRRAVPVARRR